MESVEEDAPARQILDLAGTSPSHHAVRSIIVGAALANAEKLPVIFASSQADVKVEKGDPFVDNPDESYRYDFPYTIAELAVFKEKLLEDERLSEMYKLRHNFSDIYDNRNFVHPHGTTNFDYKAVAEDRKEGFERFKFRVRKENYKYLRDHPEIRALISIFIKKLLTTQPPDPGQYLAEYFSTRLVGMDFQALLENEMMRISRYRANKMKAKGMINFVSTPPHSNDDIELEDHQMREANANYFKKLNIGPLAKDFYFDGYLPKKKVSLAPPPPVKKKKNKKCKICPDYCICVKGKGVRNPDYIPPKKSLPIPVEEPILVPPKEGEEEDEEEEETAMEEAREGAMEDKEKKEVTTPSLAGDEPPPLLDEKRVGFN